MKALWRNTIYLGLGPVLQLMLLQLQVELATVVCVGLAVVDTLGETAGKAVNESFESMAQD
jgi:hypothetical protein